MALGQVQVVAVHIVASRRRMQGVESTQHAWNLNGIPELMSHCRIRNTVDGVTGLPEAQRKIKIDAVDEETFIVESNPIEHLDLDEVAGRNGVGDGAIGG